MNTDDKIQLTKWRKTQGIDDVYSNNRRNYLKDQPSAFKEFFSSPASDTELSSRNICDNINSLSDLRKAVENFEGCDLKKTAFNTVFADGNSNAQVMVIGEAPGANEDLKGIPFCGESGQLLDKIFASIGLFRNRNIYITNIIFWRPPGNRKPTRDEVNTCKPFLEKHIALINPELLIIVGNVALEALFKEGLSISKHRQKVMPYRNSYLSNDIDSIAMFHPSYLLRQPSQKKLAWQDMLFIKPLLDKINK